MKPCSNKRKSIAMIASGALNLAEEQQLQAHLQSCQNCRRYAEELRAVTEKMAIVADNWEIEASDAFHRKLLARLETQKPARVPGIAAYLGYLLNWRIALPATAVCAILIVMIFAQHNVSHVASNALVSKLSEAVASPGANANTAPTIANYQMAADQSLRKFDEFLNQEAKQTPSSAQTYAALPLTLADLSQ